MSINFKNVFGVHAEALTLYAKRSELLAGNLANADTPGFKAKDIDFNTVFKSAQSPGAPVQLEGTHEGHFRPQNGLSKGQVKYRVPSQSSIDGNSVESQVEQAKFTENALRYQISLRFLNGRITGLMTALRGE